MSDKRRIDLARFGAWIQSRLERLNAKYLTVGSFISAMLTLFAFFIVTIWPVVRSEKLDWTAWHGGWKIALQLSWFPLIMALYLKYSESIKRARVWDKLQRKRRISRQLLTGAALKDLCVSLNANKKSSQDMQEIRERILQSAALGVEELLNDRARMRAG